MIKGWHTEIGGYRIEMIKGWHTVIHCSIIIQVEYSDMQTLKLQPWEIHVNHIDSAVYSYRIEGDVGIMVHSKRHKADNIQTVGVGAIQRYFHASLAS